MGGAKLDLSYFGIVDLTPLRGRDGKMGSNPSLEQFPTQPLWEMSVKELLMA